MRVVYPRRIGRVDLEQILIEYVKSAAHDRVVIGEMECEPPGVDAAERRLIVLIGPDSVHAVGPSLRHEPNRQHRSQHQRNTESDLVAALHPEEQHHGRASHQRPAGPGTDDRESAQDHRHGERALQPAFLHLQLQEAHQRHDHQ